MCDQRMGPTTTTGALTSLDHSLLNYAVNRLILDKPSALLLTHDLQPLAPCPTPSYLLACLLPTFLTYFLTTGRASLGGGGGHQKRTRPALLPVGR